MFDFIIAGVQAPVALLVFVGFTVGIVGGFIGVAFGPSGELAVASGDTAYRFD